MTSSCENSELSDYNDLPDAGNGADDDTLPSFTVEGFWGERLDKVLATLMPDVSRARLQKLIEEGSVEVNGEVVQKVRQKVTEGDEISLLEEPHLDEALAFTPEEDVEFDVVYEDDAIVVVNKPAGLVVHPGAGNPCGTLLNGLLWRYPELREVPRAGIVHRLDRDTTGLLIVAKNDFAHRRLAAQLSDHTLRRTYECIVRGGFREDSGTVNAPIGRDPRDRKRMAVTEKNSREAVTHWEVIARYGQYTHLRCRLETGRTHQIRVHMAWIRHPIAGDPVYGIGKPELGLHSQCLHAKELTFLHPRTGEEMTLSCPLPEEFENALKKLQRTMGL